MGTGTCSRWRCSTVIGWPPANGVRPASISYSTIPIEYKSAAGVTGAMSTTSGAMYSGVPSRLGCRVSVDPYDSRAIPKSVSLRITSSPDASTSTFSGLTSRWIMPAACTAVAPSSSCRAK